MAGHTPHDSWCVESKAKVIRASRVPVPSRKQRRASSMCKRRWTYGENTSPALKGTKPMDHEEVPGMDVPWYWKLRKETGKNDAFPGLQSRKVDMTPHNTGKHPLRRKGLIFYRPIGHLPPDPNMHLCAHLYASDRNSLYIVANQMDVGDLYTQMSSLVHTTSFHGDIEKFMFGPSESDSHPMHDTKRVWQVVLQGGLDFESCQWTCHAIWQGMDRRWRASGHDYSRRHDSIHEETGCYQRRTRSNSRPAGQMVSTTHVVGEIMTNDTPLQNPSPPFLSRSNRAVKCAEQDRAVRR